MSSYNVRSPRADEFINHAEILDTLAYAEAHKSDAALARSILEKARTNLAPAHDHGTTLTHREASVLLACEDPAGERRDPPAGPRHQAGLLRQPYRAVRAAVPF